MTNKNCMIKLSAEDIFHSYPLTSFNDLHAEMISRAVQGTLIVGEAVFTIVAYFTEFVGIVPTATLLELMSISFIMKILVGLLFVIV